MTDLEYATTQQALLGSASLLSQLNLTEFIDRIDRADAVGPMVDPSAYGKGMRRIEKIKSIAEAAQQVTYAFSDLRKLVLAESGEDDGKSIIVP